MYARGQGTSPGKQSDVIAAEETLMATLFLIDVSTWMVEINQMPHHTQTAPPPAVAMPSTMASLGTPLDFKEKSEQSEPAVEQPQ